MNEIPKYSKVVYDSRKAEEGSAFFCLRGAVADGHKFAKSAYDSGARVFFCEETLDLPDDAFQVVVPDTRKELAVRAREFYGKPDEKLTLVGITGTKGKTTTSNMIYSLLCDSGLNAGVIGTNGVRYGDVFEKTANTTPESCDLYRIFADMVNAGVKYCVMEVSSQAYKMDRVYGLEFHIGIFTNLSPDHIGAGEHATFDEYMFCKAQLFRHSRISIINKDDDFAHVMAQNSKGQTYYISTVDPGADIYGSGVRPWKSDSALGVDFSLTAFGESADIRVRTPGMYSVQNAMCVAAVCRILGMDMETIENKLTYCKVQGRFEIVDALPWATFVIDYAHNEISLRSVLSTIREYSPKRLICMFGSVGDRTQLRRGEMGRVAAQFCDYCILTSDNPGYEDPMHIIRDIEKGLGEDFPHICIPDRAEAVDYAVQNARRGDVILFAGKGHEDYQLIEGKKVPFSEKDEIAKSVHKLKMSV